MNAFRLGWLDALPQHPALFIKDIKTGDKKPPRVGRTPDILRKSGPMKDKTKYNRKPKHKGEDKCPNS